MTKSKQGNKRKFFAFVVSIVLVFSLIGGTTISLATSESSNPAQSSDSIALATSRSETLACSFANMGSGVN